MLHTHVRVVSLNRSLDDAERHHGLQHTIYKIRNSAAISKIFASQLGDFDWVEPGSLASPDFQRWCVQFHNNPSVGLPIFTSILKCFAVALQALLAIAPTEIRVRILQALHFYFEAVAHERVMWSNHKSLDPSRKAAREVALQRFKDVFGAVASSCGGFHPVNESCWKQNSTVPWQDGSILVVSLPDEADGTVDYYVCVGSLHDNRYSLWSLPNTGFLCLIDLQSLDLRTPLSSVTMNIHTIHSTSLASARCLIMALANHTLA